MPPDPVLSPNPVDTVVGRLRLSIPVGYADAQRVAFTSDWWAKRLREALARPVADRMMSSVAKVSVASPNGGRDLPRSALYRLARSGDTASAQFAVTAWGTGTNALDRARLARNLIAAVTSGRHARMASATGAAREGLKAMWSAHFAGRPAQGFGSASFGTKWLHAAGWGVVPSEWPQPVVYDQYVHKTLSVCAGMGLPYPGRPTPAVRDGWIEWCRSATDAAVAGLTATDVERAVFDHRRTCPAHTGDAPTCPDST